ncbi:hypothetical protein [Haliangium sp.]|uniref:hypothetical protein n=1 Tax=Haliangium sp. TaxID=2663208 RepID=UPI003D0C1A38
MADVPNNAAARFCALLWERLVAEIPLYSCRESQFDGDPDLVSTEICYQAVLDAHERLSQEQKNLITYHWNRLIAAIDSSNAIHDEAIRCYESIAVQIVREDVPAVIVQLLAQAVDLDDHLRTPDASDDEPKQHGDAPTRTATVEATTEAPRDPARAASAAGSVAQGESEAEGASVVATAKASPGSVAPRRLRPPLLMAGLASAVVVAGAVWLAWPPRHQAAEQATTRDPVPSVATTGPSRRSDAIVPSVVDRITDHPATSVRVSTPEIAVVPGSDVELDPSSPGSRGTASTMRTSTATDVLPPKAIEAGPPTVRESGVGRVEKARHPLDDDSIDVGSEAANLPPLTPGDTLVVKSSHRVPLRIRIDHDGPWRPEWIETEERHIEVQAGSAHLRVPVQDEDGEHITLSIDLERR